MFSVLKNTFILLWKKSKYLIVDFWAANWQKRGALESFFISHPEHSYLPFFHSLTFAT
jgi:hypothetical protein